MKSLYSLVVVISMVVLPLGAQEEGCRGVGTWLPVGEGLEALYPYRAAEVQGRLHVVSRSERRRAWIVSVWTGTVWQERAVLPGHIRISSAVGYNNELYIGCAFSDSNGVVLDSGGVLRWNGTDWERPAVLDSGEAVWTMAVYDGRLVVAGLFADIGGVPAGNIAAWDGAQWHAVGEGLVPVDDQAIGVHALAVDDDVLYAGGLFREMGVGGAATSIAQWNGASWSYPDAHSSMVVAAIEGLVVYRDELYGYGRNDIHDSAMLVKWNGQAWDRFLDPNYDIQNVTDMAVHNGLLYVAGETGQWGALGRVYNVARYNGTEWQVTAGLTPQAPAFLQSVGGVLYAGGQIYRSCTTPIASVALFCDDESCGTISGTVYRDDNANCTMDTGEQPFANRVVSARPGNYSTLVRADGTYTLQVPTGSYTLTVGKPRYWQLSCPAGEPYLIDITEAAQRVVDKDFGYTAGPDIEALDIDLAGSRARPGREVSYTIRYENTGTLPFAGTLRLSYDPLLRYEHSEPEADGHVGAVLEWSVDTMPIGDIRTIRVVFTVPPDASLIGTEICAVAQAQAGQSGHPGDEHSRDRDCREIMGSYDPNMIVVSPRGTLPDGGITPQDTVLRYTIHFQNTGNDTAFRVIVIDKIPAEIDLSTLRSGASSHAYELSITANNELRWVFRNILLPDSTTDEANSHGYVEYAVHLKDGLPVGTVIRNTADIYFDYNDPVRTNTARNTIVEESATGVGVEGSPMSGVYPNPASERITITSSQLVPGTIVFYNSLGKAALVVRHAGGDRAEVNTGTLAPGMYYVRYPTAGGTAGGVLTVVR